MFIRYLNIKSCLFLFKKQLLAVLVLTWQITVFYAQTDLKVGTTPGSISASAVFEAASTSKGILIPRLTTAQMNAISSPALGLIVYNTDLNCIHFYYGGWKSQCDPANLGAWALVGNAGTNPSTHFLGTTDAQALVFRTNNTEWMRMSTAGNVGLGTTVPNYKLDIDARTGSSGNPLRLLGLNAGATTDSILTSASGVVRRMAVNSLAWGLTGNSGTVDGTNFLGTTDNIPLSFRVNNQRAGRIDHVLFNTFLGYQAGNVTTATDNTFIGHRAGTVNTTGIENTFVGSTSGISNTIGTENTAVGHDALRSNVNGNDNTAIGDEALKNNTTGSNNTATGESALEHNTTASDNTANGNEALFLNTLGSSNVAVGRSAMERNTTASRNVAIGHDALFTQSFNNAGASWDSDNIGIGYQSLYDNQPTSSSNGYRNVAIGSNTLDNNITGAGNTAIGYQAGNTITTGSNNTLLGYDADVSSATLSNATAIGNGAIVDASNKIRLGNTSVTLVETYGSFVTISDRRMKKNINGNYIGLNFIKAMRPVHYELKDTAHTGIVYDGFIAQEIEDVLKKQNISFSGLVKPTTEGGYYTVNYATFVVPLVNAVKELDTKNEEIKDENARLKAELEKIKAENAALKQNVDKNSQDIEAIKAMLNKKQN